MGKYFKYNAGDVINGVLMIRRTQKVKNNWYGEFQCPCCGKPFEAQIQHIRLGDVKNCGCERVYGLGSPNYPDDKRNTLDLTNKKFGKWTVLYPVGGKDEYSSRSIYWHCRCGCGTEKDVSSNSLVRGDSLSCGCYLHSYGEYKIREILNTLDIKFISEKVFKTCINPKTGQYLRFDFYVPKYNCCIEYDGEQHFRETNLWNSNESLKDRQTKDEVKNQWCYKNSIDLIRIPYQERNNLDTTLLKQLIIEREVPDGSYCKILLHC